MLYTQFEIHNKPTLDVCMHIHMHDIDMQQTNQTNIINSQYT